MKQALEAAAARTVFGSLRHAPLPVAHRLSRFYVHLLDRLQPRLRRTAYENLDAALPGADSREITDGVFRSIARLLVAFSRFPDLNKANIHRWIRYEGLENYLEARRQGRGVLVATAHLGAWELSAFAHALLTEPMHVVVRPLDNPAVNALVARYRQMSGNRIIGKKEAARGILQALRQNEPVGVLIDQNASLQEGAFVPFFGRPACAFTGFARLANRTGAPVVPGYAVWEEAEGKYVLHFEPPVPMTGDDVADTAAIQARLEAAIRRWPDQWLWVHRRWKTQPPALTESARR